MQSNMSKGNEQKLQQAKYQLNTGGENHQKEG